MMKKLADKILYTSTAIICWIITIKMAYEVYIWSFSVEYSDVASIEALNLMRMITLVFVVSGLILSILSTWMAVSLCHEK